MKTLKDMQEELKTLEEGLLSLDCEIDEWAFKRANIKRAIEFLQIDIADRMIDNAVMEAIDHGKYPV